MDPSIGDLVTPYCFGDASEAERHAFELHLLECDACWHEVRRLEAAVGALRSDFTLAHTLTVQDMSGLLGMSGRLDRPFGGHKAHAVIASAMYAGLYAVPVLVEFAYQWDRFHTRALLMAPFVFAWIFATTLFALHTDVTGVRQGADGFGRSLAVQVLATVVLVAVLWPFLPDFPTVDASFQTYPVHLGYLKSVFYAWWVMPPFLLWTFHFVVVLQRELAAGRHRMVFGLLTGDRAALPPRGLRYPRLWALVAFLVGIFIFNWLGVSHLFENLSPGPNTNLFMGTVLLRVTLWLCLPAVCIWWYAGCLIELKREAAAVLQFLQSPRSPRLNG